MKIYGVLKDSFFQRKPWFMPSKLWRVVTSRANPRTPEQMVAYFNEVFTQGVYVGENVPGDINPEDRIVLLYRDAIGLGYAALELKLSFKGQIEVLTGRRRHFRLTYGHWFLLLVKRFLELSFLVEIILTPFILVYALLGSVVDAFAKKDAQK